MSKEIKLTDKEVEVLRVLSLLGYQWLARDEDNRLYTYIRKPENRVGYWFGSGLLYLKKVETSFDFIQWEDEDPTKIDDLLNGV